jgi:hypothetical protein
MNPILEQGYTVIPNAVHGARAALLRNRLLQVLPEAGPVDQIVVPRLVELGDEFAAIAESGPHLPVLLEAFGSTPHLVSAYGHVKPARTAAHTGWHSDVAHLHGVPHTGSLLIVKVMLALTPVGVHGGATRLRPGSHRDVGNPAADIQPALQAGDMFVFHANVQHTATGNITDSDRLSLWFTYAQPWMRTFTGYEHDPAWLARLAPRLATEPHLASIYGLTDPYATGR